MRRSKTEIQKPVKYAFTLIPYKHIKLIVLHFLVLGKRFLRRGNLRGAPCKGACRLNKAEICGGRAFKNALGAGFNPFQKARFLLKAGLNLCLIRARILR